MLLTWDRPHFPPFGQPCRPGIFAWLPIHCVRCSAPGGGDPWILTRFLLLLSSPSQSATPPFLSIPIQLPLQLHFHQWDQVVLLQQPWSFRRHSREVILAVMGWPAPVDAFQDNSGGSHFLLNCFPSFYCTKPLGNEARCLWCVWAWGRPADTERVHTYTAQKLQCQLFLGFIGFSLKPSMEERQSKHLCFI